jgi:hypothetical protein
MRLNGKELSIREYTDIKLPRKNSEPLKLRVNALPIGLKHDFESMCPRPRPPFETVVTKHGTRKDEKYDDPAYMEAVRNYKDLERYYLVFVAINGSPELEIENIPKDITSLAKFRDEIKAAGFSEGDSKLILDAALVASNMNDEEIAKAKENF